MTTKIAITMGDPSGIGPEIIAKLFADGEDLSETVVVGNAEILGMTIQQLGLPLRVRVIESITGMTCKPGEISVLSVGILPADLPIRRVDARSGRAAFEYVTTAIDMAMREEIGAIVTAPLNKESMRAAGIHYAGHTEILADLTGTRDYAMMLVNDELRVVLVTVHLPLAEAIQRLSVEAELSTIRLANRALIRTGIKSPRIAVAGLNPHAGENGMFGTEDSRIVKPAIAAAVAEGIDASGPWPGDTIFMRARKGEFDCVVAQYHDQGLIPIKYLGVEHGVNVTVGLPFVRTSVDHGTAFDIAGTGQADHSSLRAAVRHAALLSGTP